MLPAITTTCEIIHTRARHRPPREWRGGVASSGSAANINTHVAFAPLICIGKLKRLPRAKNPRKGAARTGWEFSRSAEGLSVVVCVMITCVVRMNVFDGGA